MICCNPGKYVTPFATLVTCPVLLGKSPTILGVLTLAPCVIVAMSDVIFSGVPDIRVRIPPNCQRSTSRWIKLGALFNSRWFGPNGNSQTQDDELRDTASLLLVGRPRRALTPAQREFKDLSKGGVD